MRETSFAALCEVVCGWGGNAAAKLDPGKHNPGGDPVPFARITQMVFDIEFCWFWSSFPGSL